MVMEESLAQGVSTAKRACRGSVGDVLGLWKAGEAEGCPRSLVGPRVCLLLFIVSDGR